MMTDIPLHATFRLKCLPFAVLLVVFTLQSGVDGFAKNNATRNNVGADNSSTNAVPTQVRVVLIGGQSNADGRAAGSGLPESLQSPQANVPFYYYTYGMAANADGTLGVLTTLCPGCTQTPVGGFGPEVTLGHDLSRVIEQLPGAKLAIIKYAKGGSSLAVGWKANGNATPSGDGVYYQTFQRVVKDGMAKLRSTYSNSTVQLAGMVWVQGESDIDGGSTMTIPYGTNLEAFISDVRLTFCPTLPFVLSRISDQQTVYSAPANATYSNYIILRSNQLFVATSVTNVYLVDTDGTAFSMNPDNLHFSAVGQQALGAAFALPIGKILNLSVTNCSLVPGGFGCQWNATPGKSYRALISTNLNEWSTQAVGVVSGMTHDIDSPVCFYRVEEVYDGY